VSVAHLLRTPFPPSRRASCSRATERLGRVDILVNNAGVCLARHARHGQETFDAIGDIHARFFLVQEFVPATATPGEGAVSS
jgi:NAD(P)-dependent dehydrogenase (short-subunit alcohol dehydrogenase family)